MFLLNLCGHDFHYEMENLCRVFFPDAQIRVVYDSDAPDGVTSRMTAVDGGFLLEASFDGERDAVFVPSDTPDLTAEQERMAAVTIYRVLSRTFGYAPPWGILTGVRPSKLMNTLLREMGEDGAKRYFREKLLVTDGKTELTAAVAQHEARVMASSRPDSFSLYLSVPFCPSRCSYCSFVTHSVKQAGKLIGPFLQMLRRETEYAGV